MGLEIEKHSAWVRVKFTQFTQRIFKVLLPKHGYSQEVHNHFYVTHDTHFPSKWRSIPVFMCLSFLQSMYQITNSNLRDNVYGILWDIVPFLAADKRQRKEKIREESLFLCFTRIRITFFYDIDKKEMKKIRRKTPQKITRARKRA